MTNLEKLLIEANKRELIVYLSIKHSYDNTTNELVPFFKVEVTKNNQFLGFVTQESFTAKSLTIEEAAREVINLMLKDLQYKNNLIAKELKDLITTIEMEKTND
jgi:hypothetical protein